jgi:hypothetical protein
MAQLQRAPSSLDSMQMSSMSCHGAADKPVQGTQMKSPAGLLDRRAMTIASGADSTTSS